MGRTFLAVAFLALLAWGASGLWSAFRGPAAHPEVPPAALAATGENPPAGGIAALAEASSVPAASPSPDAAEVRALLCGGKVREAAARARAMPAGSLRGADAAAAAREAALALADAPGSGPADRAVRADEARRLLARLVLEDAPAAGSLQGRLEDLNREVLLGGREVPGVLFRHVVKPGETLDRLMKRDWKGRVSAGYGLVLWVNHIPSPDRLRAAPILVPEEPVRLLVRKREHSLRVLLGEVPIRTFPVGLGMNGRTPEGTFEVEEMMPRPDYWPPGGKRVPFGHRDNPLGTRWLGFRDTADAQGFGIHGTAEPSSIGKDLSQGCVRLLNADVEELFTWVAVGTKVEIVP